MNLDKIEIRSEEVQDVLTATPKWMIRWGNTLILVIVLMLLFMSWFIKYPDIVTSQVVITSLNPPEKLYAKHSGRIDDIFIENKQLVSKNQPLAVVENSAIYSDVLLLKSIIDTLSIDKRNFVFPIEKLPPLILGDINGSFSAFENNYTNYVLNNKLKPFQNEKIANQFTVIETKKRYQLLMSQQELSLQELNYKKKDLTRQQQLFEKGVIAEKELELKQIEIVQAEKTLKNLEASISQVKQLISDSEKLQRSTTIEKTTSEILLLKKVIQSYYQLKKEIKDWEQKYVLTSTIEGEVNFLEIWNKNQTVKSGDLIFSIVQDNNGSYIGKIRAAQANSGKIKKNQEVNIQLFNYPSNEFGELKGIVKHISSSTNSNGEYIIDVELPNELTTTYGQRIEFKQEMEGVANIITEDLRLIERLLYQVKGILN